MIQDAIKALASIQQLFNETFSIEIIVDGSINLFTMADPEGDTPEPHHFNNAQQMLIWMDENLTKAK